MLDVQSKKKTIVGHPFAHDEVPGFGFDVAAFFARGEIQHRVAYVR